MSTRRLISVLIKLTTSRLGLLFILKLSALIDAASMSLRAPPSMLATTLFFPLFVTGSVKLALMFVSNAERDLRDRGERAAKDILVVFPLNGLLCMSCSKKERYDEELKCYSEMQQYFVLFCLCCLFSLVRTPELAK